MRAPSPATPPRTLLFGALVACATASAAAQVQVGGTVDHRTTPPANLFRNDPGHASNTHTVLFQEQAGRQLGYDLEVDIVAPGHFGGNTGNGWSSTQEGVVAAGTEFDVYILAFNDIPMNAPNGDGQDKHSSSGTVQFPADILGIQMKVRSFKAAGNNWQYGGDAELGNPATLYPGDSLDPNGSPHRYRGLEPGQAFSGLKEELHWHVADPRRLEFTFIVSDRPDHVRVITAKAGGAADPIDVLCPGDSGCPCGNDTPAAEQAGCANSTGSGAKLRGSGAGDLVADDLNLTLSGLPAGRFAIVFLGPTLESTPIPFGDGLRCVSPGPPGDGLGGGFLRLPIQYSGAGGTVQYSGIAAQLPGTFASGSTWGFQGFYRDPASAGCTGAGFNLSNGLAVTFQ